MDSAREAEIATQLDAISARIAAAAARVGRNPSEITLVAVSKGQDIESMRAYARCAAAHGIPVVFGENYVQELKAKLESPEGAALQAPIHFIGRVQSNKARELVRRCAVVQSIESERALRALDKEAAQARTVLPVMIQVNVSGDPNKGGVAPDELVRFHSLVASCPALRYLGVMTITRVYEQPELARQDYRRLRACAQQLSKEHPNEPIAISMGMSDDFEVAIEEGATIIRIGTALFGPRSERG